MLILHCSDIHLTQDYSKLPIFRLGWRFWMAYYELELKGRVRDYADAARTVQAILRRAEERQVAHVVVSGDLTASATELEFAAARAALGSWADDPSKCTVIPGNHDFHHPAAVTDKRFVRHFGHLLRSDLPECSREGPYPLVRLVGDAVAILAVNSSEVPKVPGLSYGHVGPKQLDGIRAALAHPALEGRAVLVVVHHAPRTSDDREDRWSHRLRDAEALLELLKGPRFAILHGHIHRRFHHPATSHRPHIFGAGSSTQRGREGYWLLTVENGQVSTGVQEGVGPAN